MPSLFRFLFFVAVLVGLAFGAMVALTSFVEPETRPMEETVSPSRLNK